MYANVCGRVVGLLNKTLLSKCSQNTKSAILFYCSLTKHCFFI